MCCIDTSAACSRALGWSQIESKDSLPPLCKDTSLAETRISMTYTPDIAEAGNFEKSLGVLPANFD